MNLSTHQHLFKINPGYSFNEYNAAIIESEIAELKSCPTPIGANTNFVPFSK